MERVIPRHPPSWCSSATPIPTPVRLDGGGVLLLTVYLGEPGIFPVSVMLLTAERTPAPEARITTPYGDYSSLAVSHGLVTVKENRYKVGYLGYVWSTLGLKQSIAIRHNKNHQGTPQTHIHTPAITYTYTQTHTHTHNRRAQRACGQKGRETARRRGHAGEWVENSVCV